ncbi:MAG: transporter substrate-binding domain-containing protein, partial [Desulfobacterium sp.]|nr:transporter substrate-binding domain-containing protein [Desulfobacterium sp.]
MTNFFKTLYLCFILLWGILFLCPSLDAAVPELTPEERLWLSAHDGKIRLAHTPDWPPMDYLDENGKPTGMVADYIQLIEKKLNFRFKKVPVKSWDELLDLAKAGDIDAISAGQPTEGRRKFMTWSTPFLNLKTTIIVKKEHRGKLVLDKMQGMEIGVVHQYAVGEFIKEMYPYLTIVDVANPLDGIRKVSFGELDAMITEVPNALYIIDTEKIPNLRLAGDTGFELKHGMGIRKDWPIFSRIIEKGLASITDEEHKEIYHRWVKLETPNFYLTRAFWYSILGSIALVMLSIGIVLFWNMELKKLVLQRTEDLRINEIGLEALLALNEHPHKSIQDIIEFAFQQMMELTQSNFGYLSLEDQNDLIYIMESDNSTKGRRFILQDRRNGLSKNTKGLWGDAVQSGKALVSNDYHLSNPGLKGLPEAHKKIVRYMNVPIFDHGKIVVVAGMGNKETDYTPSDLRQLNLIAHGMWRLIQRKKAERAMHKSEQRFQDLVETSPNGIAIVQDNIIVYKNSTQVNLIGDLNFLYPYEDHRINKEDLPKVKAFYEQITKNNLSQTEVTFRFYSKEPADNNDTMTWVSCIATPIDYNDRNAFMLIFIDMTESKRFQHLLIIQDKMASLGNVSAGIAHEIRNPLSGINIYLGTIEKYFKNPDKVEKIESSILAIRSASQKIESVIKRVMNFAKPTEPKFESINLNIPVKEAINLTIFTLNKKGINILQDLDHNLPNCYAEPHLIEEVVLNLINNAADAISQTQDNGTIK